VDVSHPIVAPLDRSATEKAFVGPLLYDPDSSPEPKGLGASADFTTLVHDLDPFHLWIDRSRPIRLRAGARSCAHVPCNPSAWPSIAESCSSVELSSRVGVRVDLARKPSRPHLLLSPT